jgi:hypothetical protein
VQFSAERFSSLTIHIDRFLDEEVKEDHTILELAKYILILIINVYP